MSRLKDKYVAEAMPKLRDSLGIKNPMLVPKISKVVVNMGFGIVEKDVQKKLVEELAAITGQHPQLCKARKSVSNFKLREGMVIGAKVTLRREKMYEFLDRLFNVTLPRIRDFRGLPNRGFDGRGNYTFGLKDQTTFPEIDATQVPVEKGMDITICTTGDDKAARELLTLLGLPFAGKNKNK
ncbi:MAG: 50S ribosomal protein L5 [Kiritimatiellae bacterium]|jgi:large subunit ribosomal protein L5|nr:50S ribosomal protein L5 [Kiritimatiellia bacterium]